MIVSVTSSIKPHYRSEGRRQGLVLIIWENLDTKGPYYHRVSKQIVRKKKPPLNILSIQNIEEYPTWLGGGLGTPPPD